MNNNSPSHPPPTRLQVLIAAGEASGEKHGAALVRSLRYLFPSYDFEIFGSGGQEMRAAGVELLVDVSDIATIGIAEILGKLPKFYRAYRTLLRAARTRKPDAVVLIDWPDFNMRIAKALRRENFNIIYYVSPQVWAWRRHRVKALKRDVNQMLVILPFEKQFYEQAGIPAEYVGHPLLNAVRPTATRVEFCHRHKLQFDRPIIVLLPGSRHSEIRHHMPLLIDVAERLQDSEFSMSAAEAAARAAEPRGQSLNTHTGKPQFVVPLASTISRSDVINEIRKSGRAVEASALTIVEDDTYNALFNSEFAIVASGTATVEAALAGAPMVIIYRGSELNWRLIRPLIDLDTFGMVNLIADRKIVPEFIQHEATGEKVAREVVSILSDPTRLAQIRAGLDEVKERLRIDGASGPERAAAAVMRTISR